MSRIVTSHSEIRVPSAVIRLDLVYTGSSSKRRSYVGDRCTKEVDSENEPTLRRGTPAKSPCSKRLSDHHRIRLRQPWNSLREAPSIHVSNETRSPIYSIEISLPETPL